jgi:hypothetical protein
MNHTLRSVIEEELQKAYERGVQDGMKREHAMWVLAKIGQEIEAQPDKTDIQIGLTYEEANPPEELARLEQAMIEAWKPIPKKEWVGLTDEERSELWWSTDMGGMPEHDYGKKVEALLKEKNT